MTRTKTRALANNPNNFISVADLGVIPNSDVDQTDVLQDAIDNYGALYFPPGSYRVSELHFRRLGGTYSGFPNFYPTADDSVQRTGLIHIEHRELTFESLNVSGNFNANYKAAIHWYSPTVGQPAQYVCIKQLSTTNCLIGILFGQLEGTDVVDAPQSENRISQWKTRGCRSPLYMRQPNGFLLISDSVISSIRNEWEISNPGVYKYSESSVIEAHQGSAYVSNSKVIKTDTQENVGIYMNGGGVWLSNIFAEIASQNVTYGVNGGICSAINTTFYMANAAISQFGFDDSNSGGSLWLSNSTILRSAGAINSSKPCILWIENNPNDFDFKASDCIFTNYSRSAVLSFKDNPPNLFPPKCSITGCSSDTDSFYIPTSGNLIRDGKRDPLCNSTDGYYGLNSYGGIFAFETSTEAPTGYSSSLKLVVSGSGNLYTFNPAATPDKEDAGISAKPLTRFYISYWIKREGVGNLRCRVLGRDGINDAAALFLDYLNISAARNDEWIRVSTLASAPAGANYVGLQWNADTVTDTITTYVTDINIVPLDTNVLNTRQLVKFINSITNEQLTEAEYTAYLSDNNEGENAAYSSDSNY